MVGGGYLENSACHHDMEAPVFIERRCRFLFSDDTTPHQQIVTVKSLSCIFPALLLTEATPEVLVMHQVEGNTSIYERVPAMMVMVEWMLLKT